MIVSVYRLMYRSLCKTGYTCTVTCLKYRVHVQSKRCACESEGAMQGLMSVSGCWSIFGFVGISVINRTQTATGRQWKECSNYKSLPSGSVALVKCHAEVQ